MAAITLDIGPHSSFSCVKWYNAWSQLFNLNFGVRQGSVLSPFLFALYLDDLAKVGIGLHNRGLFIALYADDILLLAPSVRGLVKSLKLFRIYENELDLLDMVINTRKSCCLRKLLGLEVMLHAPPCLLRPMSICHGWCAHNSVPYF